MAELQFLFELKHKASPLVFIIKLTARTRLEDNDDNTFKSEEHRAFKDLMTSLFLISLLEAPR